MTNGSRFRAGGDLTKSHRIIRFEDGIDNQMKSNGIEQAVQATSVGRSLLYEQIKAGKLKTFKIGTRTLIAAEDLNAWLDLYKPPAPSNRICTPDEGAPHS